MKDNFWKKLPRPFFVLAPMADVTDMAFRQIIVECGKPDVLYTEFVSAAGLVYLMKADPSSAKAMAGKAKLLPHLKFGENERPIVAQIFGSVPKHFYECAKLIVELGFDGIDINMGCPAGKIVKQDSGSGLILNPELAQEIIRETKRGIGDAALLRQGFEGSSRSSIPVSIKTRIGYNSIITEEWITKLIEAKPDAIIVHGRTMKEASKVPAHWDEITKAGKLCREAGILIIGNGDVMSYVEGVEKAKQYNLDGIMIGRGVFHNPWFFNLAVDMTTKTSQERVTLLKHHISNFINLWGDTKNYNTMKKFFKIYISGFPASPAGRDSAKEFRDKLMQTKTSVEALALLE